MKFLYIVFPLSQMTEDRDKDRCKQDSSRNGNLNIHHSLFAASHQPTRDDKRTCRYFPRGATERLRDWEETAISGWLTKQEGWPIALCHLGLTALWENASSWEPRGESSMGPKLYWSSVILSGAVRGMNLPSSTRQSGYLAREIQRALGQAVAF